MKFPLSTGFPLLLSLWASAATGYCPDQDIIFPCTCSGTKNIISVQCKGPGNTDRISFVTRSIETSQNLELDLESLTLEVLPDSVQKATALRLCDVHMVKISNSLIQWPKLNDLVIESSTMSEHPWPYLKTATFLRHLKVSNVVIPRIGSDFKDGVPSRVAYLDIRKTQTTELESNSMSNLIKLKYLLMVDIPLKHFSRDVLPLHLPHLHTFILGNTQIDNLEPGFFEGMPKLEVLMLNGNQLVTLSSNLFAPVEKHLTHLLAERNPLVCDCNLVWLRKKELSMNVLASCTDHETNTRKEVLMVDEDQYCS